MDGKTTHIYGALSIALGAVSLLSQFNQSQDSSTLITLLTGWAVAIVNYAIILFILKGQSRSHDRIVFLEGALKEKSDEAQKLLTINEFMAQKSPKEIPISREPS